MAPTRHMVMRGETARLAEGILMDKSIIDRSGEIRSDTPFHDRTASLNNEPIVDMVDSP